MSDFEQLVLVATIIWALVWAWDALLGRPVEACQKDVGRLNG
jgi:hypothetical protein